MPLDEQYWVMYGYAKKAEGHSHRPAREEEEEEEELAEEEELVV